MKVQVQLSVRIGVEAAKALDEYSKANDVSKASVTEAALVEYLERKKAKQ